VRVVAVALLLVALAAHADEPELPTRQLHFAQKDGKLLVSATFRDIYDEQLLRDLGSGFSQLIFVRLYVYAEGEDQPVWLTVATYLGAYAQWDEEYLIRVRDPTGERNIKEKARAIAVADMTTIGDLPVCPISALVPGRGYFIGAIVEVNPVTPELVAEVRKWLTRPRGGQVGTDSLFGSFVSIFANPKVPEADKTVRFRSQPFSVQRP